MGLVDVVDHPHAASAGEAEVDRLVSFLLKGAVLFLDIGCF